MNKFRSFTVTCVADVICADAGIFDVAVCNPPYRDPSSGRTSVDDERRIARHELNGGLGDFLGAGAFFLRNKGRMALVYLALRIG